VSF
jgi:hypothetical protein